MTYAGSEDSTFDQRRFGPKTMAILLEFILVNSEYWAKSRRKAIKYLERKRREERGEEGGSREQGGRRRKMSGSGGGNGEATKKDDEETWGDKLESGHMS